MKSFATSDATSAEANDSVAGASSSDAKPRSGDPFGALDQGADFADGDRFSDPDLPAYPLIEASPSADEGRRVDELPRYTIADRVGVGVLRGVRFVELGAIVLITAEDDASRVHLASGGSLLTVIPLQRWQLRLPLAHFARVHRSTIVGLGHVEHVDYADGGCRLSLAGSEGPLHVSRRYASQFKALLATRMV